MAIETHVNGELPRVGDAITYVNTLRPTVALGLFFARVVLARPGDVYFETPAWSFHLATEGIVWIRGEHNAQSAEGKALLVAYALSRST